MTRTRSSKTQKKAEVIAGVDDVENRTCRDGSVPDNAVCSGKSGSRHKKKSEVVSISESKLDQTEEVVDDRKDSKKMEGILSKKKKTAQRKSETTENNELKMKKEITVTENYPELKASMTETNKSASVNNRKSDVMLSSGTSKLSRRRRTNPDNPAVTDDIKLKGKASEVKETHRQSKATAVDEALSHKEDKNQMNKPQSRFYKTKESSAINKKGNLPDPPTERSQKLKEMLPNAIAESGNVKAETDDSVMVMTEDSTSSDSEFEEVETRFKTPDQFSLHFDSKGCDKFTEDSLSDFEMSPGTSASVRSGNTTGFTFTSGSTSSFTTDSTSGFTTGSTSSFTSGSTSGFASSSTSGLTSPSYGATGSDSGKSGPDGSRCKATTRGRKAGKSTPQQKTVTKQEEAETPKTGSKRHAESSKKKLNQNKAVSPKKQKVSEEGESDIMALLMQMEGQPVKNFQAVKETPASSTGQPSSSKKARKRKSAPANKLKLDSSEESDWEEVEDHKQSPVKSQIPDAPVQVTITDEGMMHRKRKKKKFDWAAYVRRRINRLAKEIQVDMHKVHLLCLLAHSMQQNSICCDAALCATALSIIPSSQLKKNLVHYNPESLVLLVKWFRSVFSLTKGPVEESHSLVSSSQLIEVINDGSSSDARHLVMVLVSLLRAIGFNVRLVMSLHPLKLKVSQAVTSKSASKIKKECAAVSAQTSSGKKNTKAANGKNVTKKSTTKSAKSKPALEPPSKNKKETKPPVKLKPNTKPQSTKKKKSAAEEILSSDSDGDDDEGLESKRRASLRPKKDVKSTTPRKEDSDDFELSSATEGSNFSSDEEEVMKKVKQSSKGKTLTKQAASESVVTNEKNSEDEFDSSMDVASLRVKDKKRKNNRKILSSDSSLDNVAENKVKAGLDYWLEVFLPAEGKWIGVDCIRSVVNKPYGISESASQPLLYILGFENDGSVKDITARYAPQWLSHTRKQRVDSDWWREALEPYATKYTTRDDRENEIIKNQLIERPLPTNIGDFKNHPLYALRRHLLKYEAIYPESSIPLGYIRGEPIYARECIHTLHSRDNWLREARLVRLGETAYKMVKSRKPWKRNRDLNSNPDEPDLELFGYWQTEDYIPPPAVNGKVPKNEYGNVELFQPSMIPGGTVHIRAPALNRVAKKLGIDIAAAMTGWDHHCGFSHPVLDGWIVCEEHKDILMAAWEEDQENQRQREEEKREKRVLNNWTTLARGLLIKERLKKKFNLEDKTVEREVKKKPKAKKGEKATDMQHAWPAKQQHKEKPTKEKPLPHASHFEVETM